MCVRIDSSGNDKFPRSIDSLVERTGDLLQVLSYEHDRGAFHENIGRVRVNRSHNMSVPDEGFHRGKYSRKFGDRRVNSLFSTNEFLLLKIGNSPVLSPNFRIWRRACNHVKTDHDSGEFEGT